MKAKLNIFIFKIFRATLLCKLFILASPAFGQVVSPNAVLNSANNIATQIEKVGDEAKAKYAENIDKPYIPFEVNPEYNNETAKSLLTRDLKKYVNYYSASRVPAYQNSSTNLTIKSIKNGEVTDDYVRFTSGNENHFKDTVTIWYKDIIDYQITYYVKIAENGFYMPYVRVKDHLLTCAGKEVADLFFYFQHECAVKYYQEDLENFKTIAKEYQTLSDKPAMADEQRKLFVQANAMNEKLNYEEAIVYYGKALKINPISYPAGYYNLALIAGLAQRYELAILNMKKYLLLLPDAPDAVAAQDKIYEWEVLVNKN